MNAIVIQDANILIDLININLFDLCLSLPYSVMTTDVIFNTELNVIQIDAVLPHISSSIFSLITILPDDLIAIKNASLEDKRLSEQDWSVIYYAEKLQARILTGDKHLRNIRAKKKLTVSGILWIFDELVLHKVISCFQAINYM